MRIAAVGRALPLHRYPQTEITALLAGMWRGQPALVDRLARLHHNTGVDHRHLVLPLEQYRELDTFGKANDRWIEHAPALAEHALREALDEAGLGPRDIDAIFAVSVTGVASPSLDAMLHNRMGLRADCKRVPIFGLGCVAGTAGIARAADYVRAFPDQVAVLVSVELCSLTFQRDDLSLAHVISAGLFGDGAAAAVVVGEQRARRMGLRAPQVVATRSVFYPDTQDVMGWHIGERGFRIILSPKVPEVARERLGPDADAFLAELGLQRRDIARWICHPGGPKVLRAMQESLGLDDDAVATSWRMLREQGNLSSVSVLMVLREVLHDPPGAGRRGLMLAMGPGFCSELVLLQWP
jgi:alkylresorcinol/alkylpyrone synthase